MKQHLLCLKELSLFQGLSKDEFNSICPGVINKSVLLRLANEYGRITPDFTIIELPLNQQEMGNMIGASRVKVSQVLKELRGAGIVGHNGKYYTVKTDFCTKTSLC